MPHWQVLHEVDSNFSSDLMLTIAAVLVKSPHDLIIVSAMLLLNNKRGSKGDAFSDIPSVVVSREWCNRRTITLGWVTLYHHEEAESPCWFGEKEAWRHFVGMGVIARNAGSATMLFSWGLDSATDALDKHWLVSDEMAMTQGPHWRLMVIRKMLILLPSFMFASCCDCPVNPYELHRFCSWQHIWFVWMGTCPPSFPLTLTYVGKTVLECIWNGLDSSHHFHSCQRYITLFLESHFCFLLMRLENQADRINCVLIYQFGVLKCPSLNYEV